MTLLINQIGVDFTLEKEKTFADLTSSLRAWAAGGNMTVVSILADGRALGPEDQTLLDALDEVVVETVTADESDLVRVEVVVRFFSLLAEGLRRHDQGLISELRKEFPAVRSALSPLLDAVAVRLEPWLALLDAPWADPEALE